MKRLPKFSSRYGFKRFKKPKAFEAGGEVESSPRKGADGVAQKGRTRCKTV